MSYSVFREAWRTKQTNEKCSYKLGPCLTAHTHTLQLHSQLLWLQPCPIRDTWFATGSDIHSTHSPITALIEYSWHTPRSIHGIPISIHTRTHAAGQTHNTLTLSYAQAYIHIHTHTHTHMLPLHSSSLSHPTPPWDPMEDWMGQTAPGSKAVGTVSLKLNGLTACVRSLSFGACVSAYGVRKAWVLVECWCCGLIYFSVIFYGCTWCVT